MIPQIIGTKRSNGFRRCERYCRERRIEYQSRDPIGTPLCENELEKIASSVGGAEQLIDEESPRFSKLGLAYMEYDTMEELMEHPELLKTPIVRTDVGVAINPDPSELDRLFVRG